MKGIASIIAVACVGCASATEPADEPSDKTPYWEAGSTTDEGKSTHLWIVNRAVAILGKHQALPRAARAYARLTNATCSSRWRQGLDDADHKPSYNNWYTWSSHFFDPSTGTNYRGDTDPIAYDKALEHLALARSRLAAGNVHDGCYSLGLALHYATDIMQPMHAANFAATDWPVNLHSHLEDRAAEVQGQFVVADWTSAPTATAASLLGSLAWASHGQWPATWSALANAYARRCDNIDEYYVDHTSCWSGDTAVDAAIGTALRSAQRGTAAFLFAADLP